MSDEPIMSDEQEEQQEDEGSQETDEIIEMTAQTPRGLESIYTLKKSEEASAETDDRPKTK